MPMVSARKLVLGRKKKLPEEIQLRFLRRMNRFLKNGYSLQDALEAAAWDKDLKKISSYFLERLTQGAQLDIIFEESGFHPSITAFIYFVNANANLSDALEKCTNMMEHRFEQSKKFKTTIRYPLLLLFVFTMILLFINQQILPAFEPLLRGSPEALAIVVLLKGILDFFELAAVTSCILFLILSFAWRIGKQKIPVEDQLRIFRRIPIYKSYLKIQTSFQFAAHFSSLLTAGLTLKEILHEITKQTRLPVLSYYAQLLTDNLAHGYHISYSLDELPFIESQLAAIFQKDTNKAMLEKDLSLYSDLLLEEMQRLIVQTIYFIQPVFYLVLGLFIIFIYLSLMWPMFQLINTF